MLAEVMSVPELNKRTFGYGGSAGSARRSSKMSSVPQKFAAPESDRSRCGTDHSRPPRLRECPRTDGMKLCEEILIDTAKRQQMAKREPPTMQEGGVAPVQQDHFSLSQNRIALIYPHSEELKGSYKYECTRLYT